MHFLQNRLLAHLRALFPPPLQLSSRCTLGLYSRCYPFGTGCNNGRDTRAQNEVNAS